MLYIPSSTSTNGRVNQDIRVLISNNNYVIEMGSEQSMFMFYTIGYRKKIIVPALLLRAGILEIYRVMVICSEASLVGFIQVYFLVGVSI